MTTIPPEDRIVNRIQLGCLVSFVATLILIVYGIVSEMPDTPPRDDSPHMYDSNSIAGHGGW